MKQVFERQPVYRKGSSIQKPKTEVPVICIFFHLWKAKESNKERGWVKPGRWEKIIFQHLKMRKAEILLQAILLLLVIGQGLFQGEVEVSNES